MAAESRSRAGEGRMNPQAGLHSRCDINLYTNWWQTYDSWHTSPLHIMSPIDFLFQKVSTDTGLRNWFSAGKMWQVQWGKLINGCSLLHLFSSYIVIGVFVLNKWDRSIRANVIKKSKKKTNISHYDNTDCMCYYLQSVVVENRNGILLWNRWLLIM